MSADLFSPCSKQLTPCDVSLLWNISISFNLFHSFSLILTLSLTLSLSLNLFLSVCLFGRSSTDLFAPLSQSMSHIHSAAFLYHSIISHPLLSLFHIVVMRQRERGNVQLSIHRGLWWRFETSFLLPYSHESPGGKCNLSSSAAASPVMPCSYLLSFLLAETLSLPYLMDYGSWS